MLGLKRYLLQILLRNMYQLRVQAPEGLKKSSGSLTPAVISVNLLVRRKNASVSQSASHRAGLINCDCPSTVPELPCVDITRLLIRSRQLILLVNLAGWVHLQDRKCSPSVREHGSRIRMINTPSHPREQVTASLDDCQGPSPS
jgi:hypothetical protein